MHCVDDHQFSHNFALYNQSVSVIANFTYNTKYCIIKKTISTYIHDKKQAEHNTDYMHDHLISIPMFIYFIQSYCLQNSLKQPI